MEYRKPSPIILIHSFKDFLRYFITSFPDRKPIRNTNKSFCYFSLYEALKVTIWPLLFIYSRYNSLYRQTIYSNSKIHEWNKYCSYTRIFAITKRNRDSDRDSGGKFHSTKNCSNSWKTIQDTWRISFNIHEGIRSVSLSLSLGNRNKISLLIIQNNVLQYLRQRPWF